MLMPSPQRGFTMTEMVVTVAVLAILAALAVPSFQSTIDKRRLTGAAEQLYGDLQYARSEAIKGNTPVSVTFAGVGTGTAWCYGIDDNLATVCNCNAPATCTVSGIQKVFTNAGFRGVNITDAAFGLGGGTQTVFEQRRGLQTNGTVILGSASGGINVVLSPQGRIMLCSPSTPSSPALSGYPACPPPPPPPPP